VTMREDRQEGGESSPRSTNVSAAQVARYLKGISFPANRGEVVATAKSNGAPENVMRFMNNITDKTYSRPTEVEQEFGKIK